MVRGGKEEGEGALGPVWKEECVWWGCTTWGGQRQAGCNVGGLWGERVREGLAGTTGAGN